MEAVLAAARLNGYRGPATFEVKAIPEARESTLRRLADLSKLLGNRVAF
jgi:hypothetical protein